MADIRTFRGMYYNPTSTSLNEVFCPPYDRISPALHQNLLNASPHNAVRMALGYDTVTYRASADSISQWLREGILVKDEQPFLYVISQSFKDSLGTIKRRVGFVGLCKLEDFSSGMIAPHLKTLPRPREDRFRQIQGMSANTTQIVALYEDTSGEIEHTLEEVTFKTPFLETSYEEVIHRVWRLEDHSLVQSIQQFIKNRRLVIAEGHHAYEAALTYRDMMKMKAPRAEGDEPFQYVMMCCANMENNGMAMLPVHRLVNPREPVDRKHMLFQLTKHFKLKALESREQMHLAFAKRLHHTFGIIRKDGMWLAVLNDNTRLDDLLDRKTPPEIRNVDATILHSYIFTELLRIDEHDQLRLEHVDYCRDAGEAMTMVEQEKFEMAFLLPPVQINQLRTAVRAGCLLPPKSTCFHPSIPTGLLMRRLDEMVR